MYLLRLGRIFGIFPFEITDNDIRTSAKLKIFNFIIIFALSISALLIGRDYFIGVDRPLGLLGSIVEILFGFSSAIGATVMLTNSAAMCQTFHKIMKFTRENLFFYSEEMSIKRNNIALALLIFEICAEVYFIIMRTLTNNPKRPWSFSVDFSYMIVRFYNVLLETVAILFISGANNLFKLINGKLRVVRGHFFQKANIFDLRLLHADAGDLFNEVHKCFQLYFLANVWSQSGSLCYTVFHFLRDPNFKVWEEIYWVSYILAQIMALVMVCSVTVNEVM